MHRTKPMGARSLLDSRSMVSAWCRSIQIERNQKSFVCKNMNSGSFVRVSSFAGSMLATIHSLKTCTRCSRMRSFFCCERLSASMARSLHLSFICIPQSTRALDQGGVEPRQAVSPKALRPWTIPLRYSVGCSRMRSLLLEIVRAAATLSNVRNLSLRYRNRRHET